ncbi:hypothetical protein [Jannaschia seohaensis]|uniref:Uncharacterized protein n=1 Tax=Jannaschia seohaensis TaxID=475081 RepID=A0A2Y9B9Q8_9RHOB|nr:hypothetical protein [Jannaschia seohaensis]PWJ12518.1 hypothetical protein BCF38_11676 [Jannaschia seohaensis]SSA50999.1 hypothetical protein SAMN05421539_11676 [Jannaschia seohaensis]
MSGPGPDRREARIYLVLSLAGLAILVGAVLAGGFTDFGAIEVVAAAALFFGGTAIWAVRRLWRRK